MSPHRVVSTASRGNSFQGHLCMVMSLYGCGIVLTEVIQPEFSVQIMAWSNVLQLYATSHLSYSYIRRTYVVYFALPYAKYVVLMRLL